MSSLISTLSADCVLHILSFHQITTTDLVKDTPTHNQLHGYFADDPNREIFFMFQHFSLKCSVADESFSCIFKQAANLRIKAKIIDPTCIDALRLNFRLKKFMNEDPQTCSATVQALSQCKQLCLVSLESASQLDIEYLLSKFPSLTTLSIAKVIQMEEDENSNKINFENYENQLQLIELGLKRGSAPVETFVEPVHSLFNIRHVVLNNEVVSESWFDNFSEKEAIRTLDLSNCTITKNLMYRVATNSFLRRLIFNSCNLNSDIVSPLFDPSSNMSGLEVLHLKTNPKVTFKAFKGVERLDESMKLSILPKLRTVNMGGCKLGPKGALALAQLCGKSLKTIYLENSWIGTKGAASILQNCCILMSFNAAENDITLDPSTMNTRPIVCSNLRRLKLRRNNVSVEGVQWLSQLVRNLPDFWSLELNDNKGIGDQGAEYLFQCPNVTHLSLNQCNITDHVILKYFNQQQHQPQPQQEYVYPNTTLESLYLAENHLTDASAECLLTKNKTLKSLVISKNHFTEKGIKYVLSTSCERIWMEGYTVSDELKQQCSYENLPKQVVGFRL